MARPLPKIAPKTLEEYQELIEIAVENDKERYDAEVAKAKASAEAQLAKEIPAKREELLIRLKNEVESKYVEGRYGPEPLPFEERQKLINAGTAEIEKQLEQYKAELFETATSFVERAKSADDFEHDYSCFKTGLEHEESEPTPDNTTGFSYTSFYELGNGEIYSVADADIVSADSVPEGVEVIKVNDSTEEFKDGVLRFYKAGDYPNVKIGACLLTKEEYAEELTNDVNEMTSRNITDGFQYNVNDNTYHFSFDKTDQSNFANAAVLANMEETVSWQCWSAENEPKVFLFTPAQFMELYTMGAMKHLEECLAKGRELKERIRNAQTKEELKAIASELDA